MSALDQIAAGLLFIVSSPRSGATLGEVARRAGGGSA
jgi:hypothetical protein